MWRWRVDLLSAAAVCFVVVAGCGDRKSGDESTVPADTGIERVEIDSTEVSAAVDSARVWLGIVDRGDYAGSWTAASPGFRGAVTREQWVSSMEGFRAPLGDLKVRNLESAKAATSLPGAPDGRYVVMTFNTSFTNKNQAVETVTVMQTDNGWQAAGYFIR